MKQWSDTPPRKQISKTQTALRNQGRSAPRISMCLSPWTQSWTWTGFYLCTRRTPGNPPGVKVRIHNLRWVFEQALEKAGIQELRFHDLRHTFASRLAQNGIDPYSIQKLMGHSSFSTTKRYAHHFVESLRRGIESLEISRQEKDKRVSTNLAQ